MQQRVRSSAWHTPQHSLFLFPLAEAPAAAPAGAARLGGKQLKGLPIQPAGYSNGSSNSSSIETSSSKPPLSSPQQKQQKQQKQQLQQLQQQPQPREPCLPPLPYWCGGVAVVGLPDDQLVFCFQDPTQAAATARQKLHPEAAYGAAAVKLVSLRGEEGQALLDRWQYAVARCELADLDASPQLWPQNAVIARQLAKVAAAAARAEAEASAPPEQSRALARSQWRYGDKLAAEQPATPAAQKAARRAARRAVKKAAMVAAKRAKAAAAEERKEQQRLVSREAAARSSARSSSAETGSGGSDGTADSSGSAGANAGADPAPAAVQAPASGAGRLRLDGSAFQINWRMCTIRGLRDGTCIYKFGEFEPLLPLSADEEAAAAAAVGAAAAAAQVPDGSGGSSSGSGAVSDSSSCSSSSSGEELPRRVAQRKRLLQQQLQRSQEGLEWSHAMRLAAKFPEQVGTCGWG